MQNYDITMKRGMTFVELLMVIFALMAILGALFSSAFLGRRMSISADSYITAQQQARQALDNMVTELRWAGNFSPALSTTAVNQVTFQMPMGFNLSTTAPGCLPNAVCWGVRDSAGTIQTTWQIQYRLNGTQLVREVLTGGTPQTRVLANDISQLLFDAPNPSDLKTVRIQLQARRQSADIVGGSMQANVIPGPNLVAASVQLRN